MSLEVCPLPPDGSDLDSLLGQPVDDQAHVTARKFPAMRRERVAKKRELLSVGDGDALGRKTTNAAEKKREGGPATTEIFHGEERNHPAFPPA